MSQPERFRLQQQEKSLLREAMSKILIEGNPLEIRENRTYLWGYLEGEPVLGFRWVPKKGWRAYFTLMCFSRQDLMHVCTEAQRIQSFASQTDSAWAEYQKNRNQKNWEIYQGFMAAMFTGGV